MQQAGPDPIDPRIVIVGAGPGGLIAARVLQRGGVPVSVVDADVSAGARDAGGTLDLHADSGQIALEDAGLLDRFLELARPEGQTKRLMEASTGVLLQEHRPAAGENAAPEIDRGQLRTMLAESLEPGTVRWGRRVTAVEPGDGGWILRFADGSAQRAGLVIGADGAWSRVRPQLTDARPAYTGVSFVEMRFDDVDARHPDVADLVGDGHLWANGDGRNVILQRSSGGRVRGYLGMRVELDWLSRAGLGEHDGRGGIRLTENGTQSLDTEAVRSVLLERFAGFAPSLRRLIRESEGVLANRPIFALPAPLTWAHRNGITALGDAAHLMSPFGGDGVNLALLDGAELARVVVAALAEQTSVDDAVLRYETGVFMRSGPVAAGANEAIVDHFAAGGVDVDDVPDFAEEAARWTAGAAAYRAAERGVAASAS